jgi:hypothetical protein
MNDNYRKNNLGIFNRFKENLQISQFNFLKMIFIDNIFIVNCVDCDFICDLNYSKTNKDKNYVQCLFCNKRFKNISYDIEKYYDIKLQIFMTLIIILINFFIYVNYVNRQSMEMIQLITVFIILDQSIVRIRNKKLNLLICFIIGILTFLMSYKHFITFVCSLGFTVKEIYRVKENIINVKLSK